MDQFFQYLQDEYVDTLDIAKLQQQAMDYILSGLDPHSVLIPVEDEQQIAERMQGSFSGVGVEFTIYEDTLVFVYIMEGGPAESYGLKAGDRIYAIDGDTIVYTAFTYKVTHAISWIRLYVFCIDLANEPNNISSAIIWVISQDSFLNMKARKPSQLAVNFGKLFLGKHLHEHTASEVTVTLGINQSFFDVFNL